MLKKRAEFVATQVGAIDQFTGTATTKLADYEKALDAARQQALAARLAVKAEAVAQEKTLLDTAADDAAKRVQTARTTIASQSAAARKALETDVADLASKAMAFGKFITLARQEATLLPVLPLSPADTVGEKEPVGAKAEYIYEPSVEGLLAELLPRFVNVQIYRGLLDTSASEHAARMRAMNLSFKADAEPERIEAARELVEQRYNLLQAGGKSLGKEKLLAFVALGLADDVIMRPTPLKSSQSGSVSKGI